MHVISFAPDDQNQAFCKSPTSAPRHRGTITPYARPGGEIVEQEPRFDMSAEIAGVWDEEQEELLAQVRVCVQAAGVLPMSLQDQRAHSSAAPLLCGQSPGGPAQDSDAQGVAALARPHHG